MPDPKYSSRNKMLPAVFVDSNYITGDFPETLNLLFQHLKKLCSEGIKIFLICNGDVTEQAEKLQKLLAEKSLSFQIEFDICSRQQVRDCEACCGILISERTPVEQGLRAHSYWRLEDFCEQGIAKIVAAINSSNKCDIGVITRGAEGVPFFPH